MASTSETGHVRNLANLLKYNQMLATLGSNYNPSNSNITSSAFTTLYSNANSNLASFDTAFTAWKDATNQREIAFKALNNLSTQLLGALQSTNATQQTINDFSALVKKLRGGSSKSSQRSATPTPLPPISTTPPPTTTPSTTTTTISNSQQSYDNKLQHFSSMILLLQSQPNYSPNEASFKVASLQTQYSNLSTINDAANTTYANLRASRIQRNTFFYAPTTGALDLVKQSKAYIKSVFGASSQQYHVANAIKFVRVLNPNKAK